MHHVANRYRLLFCSRFMRLGRGSTAPEGSDARLIGMPEKTRGLLNGNPALDHLRFSS